MGRALRAVVPGAAIDAVETAAEAIARLDSGDVDLVFTDVRLGGRCGTGADVAASARRRGVIVFAVSDHATAPTGVEMVGKDDVLGELPRLVCRSATR